MMSPEQFQQLLQLFQQGAQGAAAGEGPPGFAQPYRGSKLVSKHFRSDTFNGEQVKWDEWSFIFKRGIRSMSKEVFQKMQETELSPDDIDERVDLTEGMEQRPPPWLPRPSHRVLTWCSQLGSAREIRR